MKQLEAVDKIYSVIRKDEAVRAVFLKGSIARDEMDEYSDVDFYCIVKEEQRDEFLKRRVGYLEEYRPLMYWSESNFVGPQIVGVFDNGLHFDLYTVTYDSLPRTDDLKVLYDPENLLDDYKSEKQSLSEEEVATYFNEFSFSLMEFEAAYCRKDLIWASRLGSHLSGDLSMILRYIYDKDKAQLGMKRLHKKLDETTYYKLKEAIDVLGPSDLPKGVILLGELAEEIMEKLPKEVLNKINIRFFDFMMDRIRILEK